MFSNAIWYRFRAEARRRLIAWILLGAVIGIGAGTIVAAVAGAERTSSAYDRYVDDHHGLDALVVPLQFCGPPSCDIRRAEALDQVTDSIHLLAAQAIGGRRVEDNRDLTGSSVGLVSSADGRLGTEVNRWTILDGRAPSPIAADEVVVTRSMAVDTGLKVGDHVELDIALAGPDGQDSGETAKVEVEVVGIEIAPNELEPLSGGALAALYATPALLRERPELFTIDVLGVRVEGGPAGIPKLEKALQPLQLTTEGIIDSARQTAAARDRFRDDATSLLVFAIAGSLAAFVLGVQAIHRQQVIDGGGHDQLRAVGMTAGDLRRIALLRTLVVAAVAAAATVVVAVALSSLAPIGEARVIEPAPGVDADLRTIGLGLLVTVALVVSISLATARRTARPGDHLAPPAPTALRRGLERLPGLHTRLGAAMALDRSRRNVPLASILASLGIALAAVTGAVTFAAGLDRLRSTPALFGRPWDTVLVVEAPDAFLETDAERTLAAGGENDEYFEFVNETVPLRAAHQLAQRDDVTGVSLGALTGVHVGSSDDSVSALALDPVTGDLQPSIISGRLPTADDEVALGSRLLHSLGLGIGDTVRVGPEDEDHHPPEATFERRIVGKAVIPAVGQYDSLGDGALLPGSGGDTLFVRFADGTDVAAVLDELKHDELFPIPALTERKLLDVEGMGSSPSLVAALTAFLGLATVLNFGFLVARRQSHQLAVLRTLGVVRTSCVRALAAYGLLVAAIAIGIGVPVGVALGRVAWLATARSLHVVPQAAVPLAVVGLFVAALLGAVAVAMIVPGGVAVRRHLGTSLRAE